jgi:hypothetical protein
MRRLPEILGYTVDLRLKEFRRVSLGKGLEFIPFDSQKGEKLLSKIMETPEGKLEAKRSQNV